MATRRFAIYFTWSRPAEFAAPSSQDSSQIFGVLDDRYPALFEFRRAVWPAFEALRNPAQFNQSIAGFFDHVILPDFEAFRRAILEETHTDVAVIQRNTGTSPSRNLDDGMLDEIDTLIVVSLDHSRTAQVASSSEMKALRAFLNREGSCTVICPHHNIGAEDDLSEQRIELEHHGDRNVPARQRLSGFARSLLAGLGVPVENRYGLSPARLVDGSPAPLWVDPTAAKAGGLLAGVTTFNVHPHLPHFFVPGDRREQVEVLARQTIHPTAGRHPFTDAGNRVFDALLQIRAENLPGTVLVCDATLWSSAFGGLGSLEAFWKNLARLPL